VISDAHNPHVIIRGIDSSDDQPCRLKRSPPGGVQGREDVEKWARKTGQEIVGTWPIQVPPDPELAAGPAQRAKRHCPTSWSRQRDVCRGGSPNTFEDLARSFPARQGSVCYRVAGPVELTGATCGGVVAGSSRQGHVAVSVGRYY
jgi:hypothetical protein